MWRRRLAKNRVTATSFALNNFLLAIAGLCFFFSHYRLTLLVDAAIVSSMLLAAFGSHTFLRVRLPIKTVVIKVLLGCGALVLLELSPMGAGWRLPVVPMLVAGLSLLAMTGTFTPIRREFGRLAMICVCLLLVLAAFILVGVPNYGTTATMGTLSSWLDASTGFIVFLAVVAIWIALGIAYFYFVFARNWRLLSDAAVRDGLTELYSLSEFHLRSAEGWAQRRSAGTIAAALAIDIDHFKTINDRHGHLVGNEVIAAFAMILCATFDHLALIGRTGGEEFGVIVKQSTRASVTLVVEQLMRRVAHANCVDSSGTRIPFTVSIGIAFDSPEDLQHADILRRADLALYDAKKQWAQSLRVCVISDPVRLDRIAKTIMRPFPRVEG
jgi:diguanylate cyclase (GGDEF)-like protein